jgi:magnesium transporter
LTLKYCFCKLNPMLKPMQISECRIVDGEKHECPISIYINPDETERRYLIDELKIDEHTLNSALDPFEPGRMEFEPEHVALIIKRPKRYKASDNFLFNVSSVGLFMFPQKLIILLSEDVDLFEGKQFNRISSVQELVLKLIFRSILHFEEHLKVISMCSDDLEKEISTAMENKMLLNLFTLEKSLVYYLNAISSNGRVIDKLKLTAGRIGLTGENLELLDDIAIENGQCHEQAEIYSQVLSGLMDARVSVVSNNLNVLMKSLNIIMVAIMLPSLWISIFSMNVRIPLQEHPWGFWMIVMTAAVITGMLLLFMRFKKW